MEKLDAVIGVEEMFYCSIPIPNIEAHKDAIFDFDTEQIEKYGQSQTHPSIVYVANGWNGHKYWLASTPYPYATGVFENPCIYYGDEDENGNPPRIFTPINGTANGIFTRVNNPIVKIESKVAVNSDPDLYFDEDNSTMWMVSRNNQNSAAGYAQKSLDGQSWTPRGDVDTSFIWKPGVGDLLDKPSLISPAIVKTDDKIRIYTLSGSAGIYTRDEISNKGLCWGVYCLEGTTFENGGDFSYTRKASIIGKRGIEAWHFDVFLDNRTGYYYMICSAKSINSSTNYCYLAESTDGWNFRMFSRPLIAGLAHYRPSAFLRPSDNKLVVYWSTEGQASLDESDYPLGAVDIPVDGRAIGVSYSNFDNILKAMKKDNIYGY